MLEGFAYDDNAGMQKTTLFELEWYYREENKKTQSGSLKYSHYKNEEFGEFIISKNALYRIKDDEQFKMLSLLYEQSLIDKNIIFSITLFEEKEHLKWKYDNFFSLSIEEFLDRFPIDFIERQQRILKNLFNLHPNYGEKINPMNLLLFFSKNEWEWQFIYTSMVKKHWITAGTSDSSSVDPFFITICY